jgi:chromosomal replication initiation ATPase DnaA
VPLERKYPALGAGKFIYFAAFAMTRTDYVMTQLAFEWPRAASYDPEDYIVSDSNAEAVKLLGAWMDGNTKAALLTGAAASGKTHLVHCWMERAGGVMLDNPAVGRLTSEQLWPKQVPAVLEDIETIKDEAALFHLLRHAETQGVFLLLTANADAVRLPFALPDLRSRLLVLPVAHIHPPDDALLRVCVAKCFADRQIRLADDILEYIARRVERSFASVRRLADAIEKASSERGREITIPLVKKVLDS